MTIEAALEELAETWDYTQEELAHIQQLMERIKKETERDVEAMKRFYSGSFLED
jgi:molecular chaperone GrpE (heat shock protein)